MQDPELISDEIVPNTVVVVWLARILVVMTIAAYGYAVWGLWGAVRWMLS